MTTMLFIAILILGSLLLDTRKRLDRLEKEVGGSIAGSSVDRQPEAEAGLHADFDHPTPYRGPARVAASETPPAHIELQAPPTMRDIIASDPAPREVEENSLPTPAEPDAVGPEQDPHAHESSGFEDLFGRRLPIWAGGVTLIVAAVLLVKYSIDAGLLSPWVRVMLGLIFGSALIAAAELARKMERFVRDDRVAQSLAGAGVSSLYVAILSANNLYHLISPGMAFAGLTATTAAAIGLALRFGAPCAVLALLGGLATPALIQSGAPNIPLLSGYLAMVIGSLTVLSRRKRWFWLGAMALAGGMSWSALVIVMGELSQFSVLSIGLIVLLFGIALPVVTGREDRSVVLRAVAAAAAALQLGLLVSQGGYDGLSWGLYGLLSLAFFWLTERMPTLRTMTVLPLGISLFLAYLWPAAPLGLFTAVMGGIILIFGGPALWRLWRPGGGIVEAGQVVGIGIGAYFVTLHQPFDASETGNALLGVGFAALPALGAALGWRASDRQDDWRFPVLALASGFILIWSATFSVSIWLQPVAIAAVSAGLLLIALFSQDRRISNGALVYLAGAVLLLIGTGLANGEVERLTASVDPLHSAQALLRWGCLALVGGAFAWHNAGTSLGRALSAATAVLVYGFLAQIVPAPWLATVAAACILGLALIARRHFPGDLAAAMLTLSAIVMLWMIAPSGAWLIRGMGSLAGFPVFSSDLPPLGLVLRGLVGPAFLLASAFWMLRDKAELSPARLPWLLFGIPTLIGAHCLYKLIFAINDSQHFIALGLAERTIWQMLLIGTGLALWRWRKQQHVAATLLIGAGLAHNLVYSMLLHNPLWSEQSVGAWPLLNLLLPCYAIAFAAPRIVQLVRPDLDGHIARARVPWDMLVILIFAFSSLRRFFTGTILVGVPIGQSESILWSVLAIAMAIGWLGWGIRQADRIWRTGSLLLLLAAIAKVFLIDASGLEGLLRILSFLALGFSLIGVGWLYSRFLRSDSN
ncbi:MULTISPECIES: DUF2339 domain-containing protein [unclassified Sphingobium]|uniref:DUF2339 domain-containing protein n=1 Tax=unclassified Sphingobium TaxID=2611147 RepID=UPI002224EC89|nr:MULTISPECIES: DUF2339 domain-containing protein [unclassified Sphingobium]MCW2413332.1 putative membrane protein [Sphingobium sp. B8D3D]MCW2414369.1 putative membrane protein [Sphingobium sp. B8D3A]